MTFFTYGSGYSGNSVLIAVRASLTALHFALHFGSIPAGYRWLSNRSGEATTSRPRVFESGAPTKTSYITTAPLRFGIRSYLSAGHARPSDHKTGRLFIFHLARNISHLCGRKIIISHARRTLREGTTWVSKNHFCFQSGGSPLRPLEVESHHFENLSFRYRQKVERS